VSLASCNSCIKQKTHAPNGEVSVVATLTIQQCSWTFGPENFARAARADRMTELDGSVRTCSSLLVTADDVAPELPVTTHPTRPRLRQSGWLLTGR